MTRTSSFACGPRGNLNRRLPVAPKRGGHAHEACTTNRHDRMDDVMRTLAIRLEDEEHAQIQMIARLEDLSLTDALRQAIELWISERRNNPELQARAAAILDDIDRDAANRRTAIEEILGNKTSAKRTSATTRKGRGGARTSEEPTEE